jgi:hypothetical protein
VLLVRSSERIHGRAAMVAAALVGGFFPLFVTVLQGQSDLVVLVPLAAAYTAWARGRPGWAGIFSGLALAKPQLLLLVPVLFIARRSWRALAGFGAVIAALGAVSVAGFGLGPVLGYVNAVGQWAIGGSLPTNGQIVYTDTAVYSLRNVLEAWRDGEGGSSDGGRHGDGGNDSSEPREILLIVGPEGGISPREVTKLCSAGAVTALLGHHVLRSSTAGPAATVLASDILGRW